MSTKVFPAEIYGRFSQKLLFWKESIANLLAMPEKLKQLNEVNKNNLEIASQQQEVLNLILQTRLEIEEFKSAIYASLENHQSFINDSIAGIQQKAEEYLKISQKQERILPRIQSDIQTINRNISGVEKIIWQNVLGQQKTVLNQIEAFGATVQNCLQEQKKFEGENQKILRDISRNQQDIVLVLIDWPNFFITAEKGIGKNKGIINFSPPDFLRPSRW